MRVGGECEIAIFHVIWTDTIGGETKHRDAIDSVDGVDVIRGQRIGERADDGVVDLIVRRVDDGYLKERRRDAGVLVIKWDERVEGRHTDLAWECGRVGEIQLGDGELPSEIDAFEMRRSGHILPPWAETEPSELRRAAARVWRMEVAVEHAGIDHPAARLRLDREVRKAVEASLVGFVEYLPVDQPSIACQADTARADPADGKGYLDSSVRPV